MTRGPRYGSSLFALVVTLGTALSGHDARAGAYLVADETSPDVRSHARNFNGQGGELEPIRVCVDTEVNSALAIAAEPAVRNVIATFNRLRPLARQTLASGSDTDVPASAYDFESTLLHEMLHAHGVAHANHADESGLSGDAYYGTRSADGPNNVWDQSPGADGLHGSADDARGDDVNLHWFQRSVNNPGQLPAVVDETTMARTLNLLPSGHTFAANGNRRVLEALGFANAEAASVQGVRAGEAQRHLQNDDVATLRLARTGLDGIEGTSDDYRSTLVYVGRYSNPQGEDCQIPIRFDGSTSFASSSIGSFRILPNHWGIQSARLRFNASVNWYLGSGTNTVTTIVSDSPDPSTGTQPIAVRVNVAKTAGNPIATHPLGLVEVRDGPRASADTATCTITLAGVAGETGECTLTPRSGGNKVLTADYLGYGGFDASSDTDTHTVGGTVQFSAITSSASPIAVGAPLTLSWTLAPPFGAPPLAFGGVVSVKDAPDCASAPSDPAHQCSAVIPAAECAITFVTPGPHTLRLCYPGDGATTPAQAAFAQTVSAGIATATDIVQVSPATVAPQTPLQVTVRVRETPDIGGYPTGIVEVRDGPANDLFTASCRAVLFGTPGETASCTLTPMQAGPRALTAEFTAQARWTASSASQPLDVAQLRIARVIPEVSRVGEAVAVMVEFDATPFPSEPTVGYAIVVTDGTNQCFVIPPDLRCDLPSTTPGPRYLNAIYADILGHSRVSPAMVQQVADTRFDVVSNGLSSWLDADAAATGNAAALSGDGRYAVFLSEATMLVRDDTNGIADVFVRDQRSSAIRRVNTSSSGEQSNGPSATPAISANGRYVVFSSLASNLVPGDSNGVRDVFRKDLATDTLVRVSLNADGTQATADNEFSGMPASISADGRYVAFVTFARLLPRDTNLHSDVYVKDLQTGELDLVSTAADESLANFRNNTPAISADGRYVAFASQASNFVPQDTTITTDVYLKDRVTRSIRLVSSNASGSSGGDDASVNPVVSADGRYVAFMSYAHNLITPDTNDSDIYVKDLQTGAIERANTDASGALVANDADLPSISADGRYIAFQSKFTAAPPGSMTRIYIKDRQTGQLERGDVTLNGTPQTAGISLAPAISANGRFVSFHSASAGFVPDDTRGIADVFVRDRQTGINQRGALPGGAQADAASGEAAISRDGRYVVFTSAASNLVDNDTTGWNDVFRFDRITGNRARISEGGFGAANDDSDAPAISADGQWMAFRSHASNVVTSDFNGLPDIFVVSPGVTPVMRVSLANGGSQIFGGTVLGPVSMNADGNLVVFRATDTTLVGGDGNGAEDVFLRNRSAGSTMLVSANASGAFGNGHSTQAQISDDGSIVAFTSLASNLLADDSNGVSDVYVKTLADGSVRRASSTATGAPGNGASSEPSPSASGRYVAFVSVASNLVAGDDNGRSDVFVKDLTSGSVVRANLGSAGQQGSGGDCSTPALSADGQRVGFVCAQAGLVDGVAAGTPQAFTKNLQNGVLRIVSTDAGGTPANAAVAAGPHALADSGEVAFSTSASNLVPGDTQALADVFVASAVPSQRVATSTAITAHAPPVSQPGEDYAVSVSVTRTSGGGAIGGAVTITDDAATCTATLSGGGNTAAGSCLLQSTQTGYRRLTAHYAGDAAHAPSAAAAVVHLVQAPAVPLAPTIGTITRGNGQLAVAFQPPADAGSQPIDRYEARCGAISSSGTTSPIAVAGLTNGVPLSCRVRALNAVGAGAWSAASATLAPATYPSAPQNVSATRGNAQVSVTFDSPAQDGGAAIAGYIARCGNASHSGPASPLVVSGLTVGVAVSCTVSAVNAVGEGAASSPSASVVPATVPGVPTGLFVTRGNTQVGVAFDVPGSDGGSAITGYTATCGARSTDGLASPLTVTGLTNGTPVSCRVVAHNALGSGQPSSASAPVTPATLPAAPQLSSAVGTADGNGVVLNFTTPDNGGSAITAYEASCAPGTHTTNGPASPLTVGGLAAGSTVTCTVRARNDVGAGDASNGVAVTPRIQVDLAISNSNGTGFVRGGSVAQWLVEASNGSSRGASGARVQMSLPAHLSDITWICSSQGGAICPAAAGNGNVDASIDLPPGARASFLVSASVPLSPETPITTTATISVGKTYVDTQAANDNAADGPDAVGLFFNGFQ